MGINSSLNFLFSFPLIFFHYTFFFCHIFDLPISLPFNSFSGQIYFRFHYFIIFVFHSHLKPFTQTFPASFPFVISCMCFLFLSCILKLPLPSFLFFFTFSLRQLVCFHLSIFAQIFHGTLS